MHPILRKKRCCCSTTPCGNGTGCPGNAPTIFTTCTGQQVAVNRLVGTLEISGTATIDFTALTDGEIRGRFAPSPGGNVAQPIQDFTASATLSGSITIDVRQIVSDGSFAVGVGDSSFETPFPSGVTGSASGTITVSWTGAPTGWTKVKNLRTTVTGFLAAEDAGSGQARVFGEIGVAVEDLYSWTFEDGGTITAYTIVSAGVRCAVLEDTQSVELCDGTGVAFSDTSTDVTVGVAPEYGDVIPTTGVETGSGTATLSATLSRETEYPAGGTCDTCARAYDVVYSHRVTNNTTGHWTQYDATARAVQQCPTEQCDAGSCQYISPELTVTRTRDTGSPLTFTGRKLYIEPAATDIDSSGKRIFKAYFIDTATGEQDGTPEIYFRAGPCPSSGIEIISESESYTFDGDVASDYTHTLTLTASAAIGGDPACYCTGSYIAYDTGTVLSGDTDTKYRGATTNEGATFAAMKLQDGTNPFFGYWTTDGAPWIGFTAPGDPIHGMRMIETTVTTVGTPSTPLTGQLAADDQILAVTVNGIVRLTDLTPDDPSAWETLWEYNLLPEWMNPNADNTVGFLLLDDSEIGSGAAAAFSNKWLL